MIWTISDKALLCNPQKMSITSAQCRAARALLEWAQVDLADKSDVGVTTIRLFEKNHTKAHFSNREKLRRAFEDGGVEFIEENGGGPGVRLKR